MSLDGSLHALTGIVAILTVLPGADMALNELTVSRDTDDGPVLRLVSAEMRALGLFVVGTVGFVAISYFEQLPILGWLGAVVSIVAWATIGRALALEGASATWTAPVLGAWTGFIGAFSAWAFQTGNLFAAATPGLERVGAGFGFVGATIGLVYWPVIGALVCFAAAFFSFGRRFAER